MSKYYCKCGHELEVHVVWDDRSEDCEQFGCGCLRYRADRNNPRPDAVPA